jgi:hypothetical protein
MSYLIGYHTNYNPLTKQPTALEDIQVEWGGTLERMSYEQKVVMRAALAGFVALRPVWKNSSNNITCIDCCIEGAGADWDIWDADPTLVEAIQRCSQLSEGDIEGLIEVLTSQIRGKVYASRTEEWEVISPNH